MISGEGRNSKNIRNISEVLKIRIFYKIKALGMCSSKGYFL